MKIKLLLILMLMVLVTAVSARQLIITHKALIDSRGIQVVTMIGGDYYYEPNHIILKFGVPVEIHIKKIPGLAPHNIIIDSPEAGMSFDVDFGRKGEVIKFTPTKVGLFPLYCDKKFWFFKSHRHRGMEGVVEVVK